MKTSAHNTSPANGSAPYPTRAKGATLDAPAVKDSTPDAAPASGSSPDTAHPNGSAANTTAANGSAATAATANRSIEINATANGPSAGAADAHASAPTAAAPNPAAPNPATDFSIKRLLPSLAMDVFLPIITFNALSAIGVSTLLAVTAGGVFPLVSIVRKYVKTREIDALGAIVLFFLVVGTAASLISGSVFFAIVKDSFLTATFGLIIFGTLAVGRPLPFQLIRQMVAAGNEAEYARWGKLYDEVPEFRSTQHLIAIVWGVAYVVEAGARVALALVTTPAVVVNVSPFLGFGVTIGLALWTRHVMLALRERRLKAAAEAERAAAGAANASIGPSH